MPAIVISTVSDHIREGYRVYLWCPKCQIRQGMMNLGYYQSIGKGHKRPIELRLTCDLCEYVLDLTVEPHPAPGGRPEFLLQPDSSR